MDKFLEKISTINTLKEAKETLFEVCKSFDTEKIQKALDFAILAHKGQYRKSGEEYVIHPILVASITSFFSDNEDMIIAALLHDVVEDTDYEFRVATDKWYILNWSLWLDIVILIKTIKVVLKRDGAY